MQLVRTAQPKHKINLLSLSTEAGGPDVGHLVCSINSMQFVRTAQFKHKHLLALYSHSPRRTGGPQAPASGALVYIYIYIYIFSFLFRIPPNRCTGFTKNKSDNVASYTRKSTEMRNLSTSPAVFNPTLS